jgi:hypothetical protein
MSIRGIDLTDRLARGKDGGISANSNVPAGLKMRFGLALVVVAGEMSIVTREEEQEIPNPQDASGVDSVQVFGA